MPDAVGFTARVTGTVPEALAISFGEARTDVRGDGTFTWSDGKTTIVGSIEPDARHTGWWPSRTLVVTRFDSDLTHEDGACETASSWSGALTVELR